MIAFDGPWLDAKSGLVSLQGHRHHHNDQLGPDRASAQPELSLAIVKTSPRARTSNNELPPNKRCILDCFLFAFIILLLRQSFPNEAPNPDQLSFLSISFNSLLIFIIYLIFWLSKINYHLDCYFNKTLKIHLKCWI